jgi:hypothetical protein
MLLFFSCSSFEHTYLRTGFTSGSTYIHDSGSPYAAANFGTAPLRFLPGLPYLLPRTHRTEHGVAQYR